MPYREESIRALMAPSGVVLERENVHATLEEICRIAVRAVPGADGATVTALSETGAHAAASDDERRVPGRRSVSPA